MIRRRDTAWVDAAERPSDEHYRRFLTLVWEGRRGGCQAAGERVAAALRARVDGDGLVRAVDVVSGETLAPVSAGSALALLAPGLPQRAVEAGRDLVTAGALESELGVRSLERAHPELRPRNYWRGPVWANVTALCAHGLSLYGEHEAAAVLGDRMLEAVRGAGMREYFNPESGAGLGARDFAWTAALTLRRLARM